MASIFAKCISSQHPRPATGARGVILPLWVAEDMHGKAGIAILQDTSGMSGKYRQLSIRAYGPAMVREIEQFRRVRRIRPPIDSMMW